ncbi:MAG: TolC family protein [Clostridiales bacterium]|nr:TolC family protein [Clostridiales bacterium]
MRKKSMFVAVSLILIVALSTAVVFAVKAGEMEFAGTEVKLSLEDAKKEMLTNGTAIEAAELKLKQDKAKTTSYYESLSNLYRLEAAADEAKAAGMGGMISGPSKNSKLMADASATFAKAQAPRNYEAAVNKIVRDTVESYFGLAAAKEAFRISQENVVIQEKLYQNTLSKFNLGVVAKQDVLMAEYGLNDAKVTAEQRENEYIIARMGFNIQYGYDLMQDVTITDTLEKAVMSKISLSGAIALALANRNEIHDAGFKLKRAELNLDSIRNTTSRTSSTYKNAVVGLAGAQVAAANAPKQVELDVRKKYLNMMQKASEVELDKQNVANAKENYRLAGLQYDAGMATLTDTQQAQVKAYQAEQKYYTTLLSYNLAILDYEQATTVGTSSVDL